MCLFYLKKHYSRTHPFPAPTDTTCMFKPPLPRTGLLPAHWPTTMPAISSFPPWGGMDWMPERKDCKVTTHQLPVFLFIFHIILIGHKLRIYLYSTMFCHLVDNQAHSFIPTRNCTTLVWSQKHFLVSIKCNCITYKTTFCSICKRKSILLHTEVSVYSTTTWVVQISVFRLLQMLKKYFPAL